MVFPFGKAIAPPLNWFPPLPSAHGPARPPRRPLARRWPSRISNLFVTLLTNTCFGAGQPWPQAAGQPPEGGPISSHPQDLNIFDPNKDHQELHSLDVPPGGQEEGTMEEENLTWLTGGDGGTVAAHAGSDDPQTAEIKNEDKSGESAVPTTMEPMVHDGGEPGRLASKDGGGDGGTVASQAAPISALPPSIPESPTQDQFEPHRGQDESESSTLVGAVPLLSDWGTLVGPMDLSRSKTTQPPIAGGSEASLRTLYPSPSGVGTAQTRNSTSDQFEPRRGMDGDESSTLVGVVPLLGDSGAPFGPMNLSGGSAVQPSKTESPTSDQFEPRRGKDDSESGTGVEVVPLLGVVSAPLGPVDLGGGKAMQPSKTWSPTSDQFEPRRGQNASELGSRVKAVPLLSEGYTGVTVVPLLTARVTVVPLLTADATKRPLASWLRLWRLLTASNKCLPQRSRV